MSDLEQQLVRTLSRIADDAPGADGLAVAARSRARRRRRTRTVAVTAAVLLAFGVPAAVVAWPDPDRTAAPDPAAPVDAGLRWESWHGVSVQVPVDWGHGPLDQWCADGADPGPVVDRPGTRTLVACTPASTYGLSFQQVGEAAPSSWPVVHQDGDAWPQPNAVGGRALDGVLVTVAAPTVAEAQAVLDTVEAIDGRDPNGCPAIADAGKGRADPGTMSVCRYVDGQLEQSELLRGAAAADAEKAIAGATAPVECDPGGARTRITMTTAGESTALYLDGCVALADGDRPTRMRALTADLLYWALSPGFTGDVTGLPLPPVLRAG